jgi:predicted nucleotidyltransferase
MSDAPPANEAISHTGLSTTTLARIGHVLTNFPQVEQALLYGSRAMGRQKLGSDIDLTLVGTDLTPSTVGDIEQALDDLLLPYEIDLSARHLLNHPELEAHIERVGVVIYQR